LVQLVDVGGELAARGPQVPFERAGSAREGQSQKQRGRDPRAQGDAACGLACHHCSVLSWSAMRRAIAKNAIASASASSPANGNTSQAPNAANPMPIPIATAASSANTAASPFGAIELRAEILSPRKREKRRANLTIAPPPA